MSWRNESYRHSLASRGVSTKRYLARKRMERDWGGDWQTKLKLVRVDRLVPSEDLDSKSDRKIVAFKESGDFSRPIDVEAPTVGVDELVVVGNDADQRRWDRVESDVVEWGGRDPRKWEVMDGHHRFVAARDRGDEFIVAKVHREVGKHRAWRKGMGLKG